MRIVIALTAQERTTRDIHTLMPDVPQASLYRAISQLAAAGVVQVVSEERRGGAMERTYRLTPDDAPLTADELESSSPAEVLGAVQTLSDMVVRSTSRYLAEVGDDWSQSELTVRHEALWLTDEERAELGQDMMALLAKYGGKRRSPQSQLHMLQIAAVPEVPPTPAQSPDA